jgi:FKBP12-rapamycin complex-associated protein
LAVAVGPALTKHMHEILDFMFSGGISSSLVQALIDLSINIPPLAATIQGKLIFELSHSSHELHPVRLLNLLSIILVGHSYHHPGAPHRQQGHATQASKDNAQSLETRDPETILLALETLGSFDFKGNFNTDKVEKTLLTKL